LVATSPAETGLSDGIDQFLLLGLRQPDFLRADVIVHLRADDDVTMFVNDERLDDYRGILNSAWLGSLMALVGGTFLSLVGFYIVKNSILRDQDTRVGGMAGDVQRIFEDLLLEDAPGRIRRRRLRSAAKIRGRPGHPSF
jgi:hypothetical protein